MSARNAPAAHVAHASFTDGAQVPLAICCVSSVVTSNRYPCPLGLGALTAAGQTAALPWDHSSPQLVAVPTSVVVEDSAAGDVALSCRAVVTSVSLVAVRYVVRAVGAAAVLDHSYWSVRLPTASYANPVRTLVAASARWPGMTFLISAVTRPQESISR